MSKRIAQVKQLRDVNTARSRQDFAFKKSNENDSVEEQQQQQQQRDSGKRESSDVEQEVSRGGEERAGSVAVMVMGEVEKDANSEVCGEDFIKEVNEKSRKLSHFRNLEIPLGYTRLETKPAPIPRPVTIPLMNNLSNRRCVQSVGAVKAGEENVATEVTPNVSSSEVESKSTQHGADNNIKRPFFIAFLIMIAVFLVLSLFVTSYIPSYNSTFDLIDLTYALPFNTNKDTGGGRMTLPRKSKYSDVASSMKEYIVDNLAISAKRYTPESTNSDALIGVFLNKSIDMVDLIRLPIDIDGKQKKGYFGYSLKHFPSEFNNRGKGLAYVKTVGENRVIVKIPFLDVMYNLMTHRRKDLNIISQPTYACCTTSSELICTKMKLSAHPNIFNASFNDDTYTDDELDTHSGSDKLKCTLRFISETDDDEEHDVTIHNNSNKLSKLDRALLFNNHVEMVRKYITSAYVRVEMLGFDKHVKCNVFVQSSSLQ